LLTAAAEVTEKGWVNVPASLTSNRLLIPIALIVPFVVSAILAIFRADFAGTNAALLLVVVVVAVAAAGQRLAGVLCALSAGVWFDFFLTEPYNQFTINDRADVETTVLLLLVGVAVTELCAWGAGRRRWPVGRLATWPASTRLPRPWLRLSHPRQDWWRRWARS
jgi:K+-sensing histidine kinase KdpD